MMKSDLLCINVHKIDRVAGRRVGTAYLNLQGFLFPQQLHYACLSTGMEGYSQETCNVLLA